MRTLHFDTVPMSRIKKVLKDRRKLMLASGKSDDRYHPYAEFYLDTKQDAEGVAFIILYRHSDGAIDYAESERINVDSWQELSRLANLYNLYDYEIKHLKNCL